MAEEIQTGEAQGKAVEGLHHDDRIYDGVTICSVSIDACGGKIELPVRGNPRSVVEDDTQQRAFDFEPAVVLDEAELAELVHEEVHA
jgi:hypothetical protein